MIKKTLLALAFLVNTFSICQADCVWIDGKCYVSIDGTVSITGDIQITDGVNTASIRNTGTQDSVNVSIVDSVGNQVTSFGTDPVGLKNTSAVAINPSTSDLQTTLNGYVDTLESLETSIKTAVEIMDDWDDADRAKTSSRLILSAIDDTTVDSTADLIFDCSADTDAVYLVITNNGTTPLFVGEDASVTTTDFQHYIPPYQYVPVWRAGNTGTTDDIYGIRAAGESGAVKVSSFKYK